MDDDTLRYGYTTGACAAAASLGAARMLKEQHRLEAVELALPAGFSATFALEGQAFGTEQASCFVIKDAGDDPDVTNGVEVHARLCWAERQPGESALVIAAGQGVGRVTKPGLAVAVGEPAINPVPRRMIGEAITSVFSKLPEDRQLVVSISIPDGEQRAQRTLNERLGIVGGLSILGTTGVVKPISHKAWTDTLEVALDVALAAGLETAVLSTGRTSEMAAQQALGLAEEGFVMMGDHVGYALQACHRKGVPNLVLAVQFAKLVKIACGHAHTHVSASSLDLRYLAHWAEAVGLDAAAVKKIECANTAREVLQFLGADSTLVAEVARRALDECRQRAPGAEIGILLIGYDGQVIARFGDWPKEGTA